MGYEYKTTERFCVRFFNDIPDWITFYEDCVIISSGPFEQKYHSDYLKQLENGDISKN